MDSINSLREHFVNTLAALLKTNQGCSRNHRTPDMQINRAASPPTPFRFSCLIPRWAVRTFDQTSKRIISIGMNMKDPIHLSRVFAAVVFGVLALPGCDEPQKVETTPRPAPNSDMVITPVDRTVVDKRGRELDVTILARDGTHARVIRKADGMKFDLIIKQLSENDQRFIYRIPETAIIGAINPDKPTEPEDNTPAYIKHREEALGKLQVKLQEQISELQLLYRTSRSGRLTPRMRMMDTEIGKTRAEIAKLENQIKTYRTQNP